MTAKRRRRGSVLLLAVGLLTILAMLGSTLLVTAWLDKRTSEALAEKAQADPIAEGVVTTVKQMLKDDLYIGEIDVPKDPNLFTPYLTGGWKTFVDYPSEDVDPHLATNWSKTLTDLDQWPHVTNLTGADSSKVENIAFNSSDHVDTDRDRDAMGNLIHDALLYDTGVTNREGQKYYAAVRVTDLSGLLNVNTAPPSPNQARR